MSRVNKKEAPFWWNAPDISHVQFVRYQHRDEINVTRLLAKPRTEEEKRALWERIKTKRPDIAAIIKDQNVKAITDFFNATILVEKNL
jgi:hypothetical protein